MFLRMLRADFRRTVGTSLVLGSLVAIAALLAALGGTTLVQVTGSINQLFAVARTPDIVQMHAGEVDEDAIKDWVADQSAVMDVLVSATVPIPVDELYLGDTSEAGSVLQPALTVQNENFDHLLGMDGEVLAVHPGEIALPVYYALQRGAEVGDTVSIQFDEADFTFEVSGFLRDSTMNPAFSTSKRLLVSEADLAALAPHAGEPEYLIEFLLNDRTETRTVAEAYGSADLPANGPLLERSAFSPPWKGTCANSGQ